MISSTWPPLATLALVGRGTTAHLGDVQVFRSLRVTILADLGLVVELSDGHAGLAPGRTEIRITKGEGERKGWN